MDKELKQHKWQAFILDEVFDIRATQSSIDKKNLVNLAGTIPYITRSDKNNGIDMFIGEQPNYKKDEGNVLTIGLDTQTIFYQPIPFYTGQNIQVIRHSRMNRYNASFLIVAIKILLQKFNWGGNGATLTRLKRSKVFLPITDQHEIDWEFMEDYMRKKEILLLKPAVEQLCKRLINKEISVGGQVKWKSFVLSDIFTISAGKRLTKADMKNGSRPFIGATDSNNGITAWVENSNESLDSEVLGVNYNGSVVETFYHPYECIFSDDVKRLHLKNDVPASTHLMLFLKTMIVQQKIKFAYGYKFNEKRMQMQKIVLPVDSEEQPNWKYMESYMQKLEQQQIEKYLHYITKM